MPEYNFFLQEMLEIVTLDEAGNGENKRRDVGHLNPVFEFQNPESEKERQKDGDKIKEFTNILGKTVQDSIPEQHLPTKGNI